MLQFSVPEIGEDLPGKYPLLKEDKNPEFTNVTIEKCVAVIGRQALEFEETVNTVGKQIKSNLFISLALYLN